MKPEYFVHESSYIEEGCKVGKGTNIWHFSHARTGSQIGENCNIGNNVYIDTNVTIGNGVKIQNNVSLYNGVIIEDNVFLGPSCVFTNVINPRAFIERKNEFRQTMVLEGASIGANATILCGNSIGRYAFVGAGAVVTKNVPDYAIVYGSPAKIHGYICQCGSIISFDESRAECSTCLKRYKMDGCVYLNE